MEKPSGSTLTNLVGALIAELADDVPDDPAMEGVRADLTAVSRSYEVDKKKDVALRFYLAIRSLLRENEMLRDKLRKAERESRTEAPSPAPEHHPPAALPGQQTTGEHAPTL